MERKQSANAVSILGRRVDRRFRLAGTIILVLLVASRAHADDKLLAQRRAHVPPARMPRAARVLAEAVRALKLRT